MGKSIVVIDTPEYCEKCNLCTSGNYGVKRCAAKYKAIFLDNKSKKPDWCPLKEVPKKKEFPKTGFMIGDMFGEKIGWNSCVDETLKGE